MRLGDTITACATGPASSGLAIVRLSGPDAREAVRAAFNCAVPEARGWHAGTIELEPVSLAGARAGGTITIPVGLLIWPDGGSFTGEPVVELQLPGQPALVDRAVQALAQLEGVRLAEPGEFTARAFLNGKMTAEQAEGVRAVIEARSSAQLAAGQRLLNGQAGQRYRQLADELAWALSLVEAGIDFTDQEDVVAIAPEELLSRLAALIGALEGLAGASPIDEQRSSHPEVVLAGRPNAGKSTLFNALLRRQRAVVADLAGTTRDAISEHAEIQPGVPIVLTDLAGLDAGCASSLAAGAIASDARAQEAALARIAQADAVVWCDPDARFEADDPALLARTSKPVIRVRTKGDRPVPADAGADASGSLAVCALDGWGIASLRNAIADAVTGCATAAGDELQLVPRHRRALAAAGAALREAAGSAEAARASGRLADPALVAGAMRAALDELGSIAGHIAPDDVIGRIFATFCIGK